MCLPPCLSDFLSSEPLFLPAWLETLHAVDAEVAAAAGVLSWDRREEGLEAALLGGIDHLLRWGGLDAEAHFRAAAPPGLPITFHGHRLGLAVVSGAGLSPADVPALGRAMALDVARFDQHACLAPHVIFVEGAMPEAVALGQAVAVGLEALSATLPPPQRALGSLATLQQRRATAELTVAMGGGALLLPASGGRAHTVVVANEPGLPLSPLERYVTLVPLASLAELWPRLGPVRRRLQNVAVLAPGAEGQALREGLAAPRGHAALSAGRDGHAQHALAPRRRGLRGGARALVRRGGVRGARWLLTQVVCARILCG